MPSTRGILQIGDDDVDAALDAAPSASSPSAACTHLVAVALEDRREHPAQVRLVVGDQDARAGRAMATRLYTSRPPARGAPGRLRLKPHGPPACAWVIVAGVPRRTARLGLA